MDVRTLSDYSSHLVKSLFIKFVEYFSTVNDKSPWKVISYNL